MEGMTKNGCQVVMERLQHIKKDTGDSNALGHCKSLIGQGKLEFTLQLKVDKGATFMTGTEQHGKDVTQSALSVDTGVA